MIWLPVLAIIVFFIFLISSIIIGYKVGWRASLFISVLFFAITFISIMICLLIYKKTLWPFYQKLFLNRLFDKSVTFSSEGSGQYSIDPLIFEEKYKSRAILIFSLMFTPLTFIIVFFSYFLLRKRINNYMRPKVTQTEINVKVINSKPKVFRSRMIGMGILGLSFLFVSSYLASGIAAASIKKDKRSFLNNITDSLTKAYSFSLASNESESRDIDQVISYIDKDFFDNTRKIWTTTNFESWDLARAQNIKNYLENSELIKEMKKLQDKDAIAKLFENVFETSLKYDDKNREEVLKYSPVISRRLVSVPHSIRNSQIFQEGLGLSNNKIVDEIVTTFKTFPRIMNLIPESTVKKIIEKFKQNFEEFNKSFAALQLERWEQKYSQAQQQKSQRQQRLASLKSEITEIQNQAVSAASKIKNYTDINSSLIWIGNFELRQVDSSANSVASQNYLNYSHGGQMGTLSSEIKNLDNSITSENNKIADLQTRQTNASQEFDYANTQVQSAQNIFDLAENRFEENQSKISRASEAILKFEQIETEISRLNREKTTLTNQYPAPADKASQLQDIEQNIQTQQRLKTEAKNLYVQYGWIDSSGAKTDKTSSQNQKTSLRSALETARTSLLTQQSNKTNKQTALTNTTKDLSNQRNKVFKLQEQRRNKNTSFEEMRSYISNYFSSNQSGIQGWKTDLTSKSAAVSVLESRAGQPPWTFSNDNGSIKWLEDKIDVLFTLKTHAQVINDAAKEEYEETIDKFSKALSRFLGH